MLSARVELNHHATNYSFNALSERGDTSGYKKMGTCISNLDINMKF